MPMAPERELESLRQRIAELEAKLRNGTGPRASELANGTDAARLPAGVRAEDILAHLTEALLVLDRDWRIVYANHEAARINRKKVEEFLGKDHWREWPWAVGSDIERQYRRVMQDRVPAHFEYFHEGKPGIWLDLHAYPCEAGITVYYRDITARKRTEADLVRSEKELRDFVENAAVGLHWVGPDGTILWANDAELKLLGYEREEYVGRNIVEFHADEPVILDILDRLNCNEELRGYEARLRRKDGAIRYVSIFSNVYWEDGRFVHTRCFTRDITEAKQAQELNSRLAAIIESSDDAVISKDLNGIIRSWNQAAERMFGYTEEEAVGKPVSMLAVPDRVSEMPDIIGRISRGERVDHYETKRQTKHGKVLTVSLTVSPIRDASGKIVGASKIARDITESERANQALREANAALSRSNADLEQFAYSASHDLQEPLRMVATYSQLLKRRFADKLGETGAQYIGYTVEGAMRMEQLIKDLLAFTHASTLGQEPSQDVDSNVALEHALANLEPAIQESGAAITRETLPPVCLHQFQLTQLFQNLIGNAIRYRSEAPPRIHVAVERSGAEWQFSVQDNGLGIDPKYKEQIFGLFKRLHSAAEYPGTGMGLAICQRVIQRAGGRIWVESELGHGSKFCFTIPAGEGRR
jgi:PAS domain S-box-containing protein